MMFSQHIHNLEEELATLVFPFIQICLNVLHLCTTTQWYPLCIHVSRFLNKVCETCHVFCPLSPILLSMISQISLIKESKEPDSEKIIETEFILKISDEHINTQKYREQIASEIFEVLYQAIALTSYSLSFPEMILPIHFYLENTGR